MAEYVLVLMDCDGARSGLHRGRHLRPSSARGEADSDTQSEGTDLCDARQRDTAV